MMNQPTGWMNGMIDSMHGGMWVWPIVSVLVIAIIAFMLTKMSKK